VPPGRRIPHFGLNPRSYLWQVTTGSLEVGVADSWTIRPDSSVWFMNSEEGGFPRSCPGSDKGADSSNDSNTGGSRRPAASGYARSVEVADAYERR
jgi:hypothetical protein